MIQLQALSKKFNKKVIFEDVTLDNKNIWDIKEKTFFKRYLGYVFQNYA